ncbi:ABC transporter ATP-binding protein [Pseudaminobacter salicylatoxidans]|uniref:ABC transporter ATP-binding protein n=1 Tax=Pseudaminobacter salicylatoxidans TaxID=93369 RepID=UPI00037C93EA|nr:ABC transporter ATP-binding protein [Pseudaminobacter salicylatoxidans]
MSKNIKVSVQKVLKTFGSMTAADNIDLDIMEGEFLTLLGASGCGKTTLMRMIAGFETVTSGKILIDGRDVTKLAPRQRNLGMVFQQYSLFPHMTIAENIGYGLRARRMSAQEIGKRVGEMLDLVQLPHLAERKPPQLSGGQQQRVALARALAVRPSVLMLDEPLGALDQKLREQLQEELRRLHRETGSTFLFVTHDQEEALGLSDRIAVMKDGKIAQLASPDELYLRPQNEYVADFIGKVTFIDGLYRAAERRVMTAEGVAIPADLPLSDGPVRLVIRPENIHLTDDAGDVAGDLVEVSRQTGTTTYQVRLDGGQVVKSRHLGLGETGLRPGSPVRLRFDTCKLAYPLAA